MKIMVVNTLYYPAHVGGAEVSVQILCETLLERGHDVQVVCLHQGKDRKIDVVNGVKVVYLPLDNLYWPYDGKERSSLERLRWHLQDIYNYNMRARLSNEIKKFRPDVVHTNNIAGFSVSIFDAVKFSGVKLVHTARDYYLLHPNSTLFKKGKNLKPTSLSCRIWGFIKKIKSRKVDCFVGISNYVANLHKDNGFARNAYFNTIYNPIEPINRLKIFNPDNVTIGFIGKLSEDKGYFDFCLLAEKFKNKSNLSFCAAGRPSDRDEKLVNLSASKSNIDLLGFIDVGSFLKQVDVVILPIKWNEPFGRTVAECAISGTLVFTNMLGGVSEIANLCKNIKPISSFNVELINKLDMGEHSPQYNPFNKDKLVSEYEKVYMG
ncbi:TPA: glycosyltransferase family 4 protein, partial [Klebsiella pneumoniae]|nr:glycosyltransferase family 4 protein [Klebsiella pneumoniae]